MMAGKFYVSTPIYYPSDNLHIGHAYTTVAADALARYHRFRGEDVFFLTGTDEHGQKIQSRAAAAGKAPQEYVNEIAGNIRHLWEQLAISYDQFIRTTDPKHKRAVQDIFTKVLRTGDIYKGEYEGWYCTPCETFWLERQLKEDKCPNPECGRKVELLKEESYFFRLSKYADRLLAHIEANPDFIQPQSRRNEMVSFIRGGLEDLCVSRTTFDWGIPLPGDSRHVLYVWFDALSNYITAAGYLSDPAKFERYWPADVHLMGKEIVRFHAVIWPSILMALDLPLPKTVFGHGWLVLEGGEKISKSKGNVVDPMVLIDRYGVDAVRYYLLREVPFGSDGNYTESALITRINVDLANDLGNLLSRTTAMIQQGFGGKIPPPGHHEPADLEFPRLCAQAAAAMAEAAEQLRLSESLAAIWRLVDHCNKYIEDTSPWALARNPQTSSRAGTVLYNLAECLRILALLLAPFLVETPGRIWEQLGLEGEPRDSGWESLSWGRLPAGTLIKRGRPLFPRIDTSAASADPAPAREPGQSPTQPTQPPVQSATVTIEEFRRLDLRVATVLKAEKVSGADRLLTLRVDVGGEERQIVAGIAGHYRPEDLPGRRVVIVANLEPATIRGLRSEGMVLAASDEGQLVLVIPAADVRSGAQVR
jgi:methionyl-tRNA synthetase